MSTQATLSTWEIHINDFQWSPWNFGEINKEHELKFLGIITIFKFDEQLNFKAHLQKYAAKSDQYILFSLKFCTRSNFNVPPSHAHFVTIIMSMRVILLKLFFSLPTWFQFGAKKKTWQPHQNTAAGNSVVVNIWVQGFDFCCLCIFIIQSLVILRFACSSSIRLSQSNVSSSACYAYPALVASPAAVR